MGEKLKLTKTELQYQQKELKKFKRFLPTLQLKKQQLQIEVRNAQIKIEEKRAQLEEAKAHSGDLALLVSDYSLNDWQQWLKVEEVITYPANIAGVHIRVFETLKFFPPEVEVFATPNWLDKALLELQALIALEWEVRILTETLNALKRELRKTTQRVNLFEKVKIPEAMENIKVIKIYLGDEDRNAVGRAKIAKKKLVS